MFYLTLINITRRHFHSWLAAQYFSKENGTYFRFKFEIHILPLVSDQQLRPFVDRAMA